MTTSRAALLAAFVLLPALAAAQPVQPQGVAVYRYVAAGGPTMTVDVWGTVRQPGRYLVTPGLSLVDVLGLAGGPAPSADGLVARTTTVTVTRGPDDARAVVERLTLDDLADGAAVPPLADGDLVVVRAVGAGRVAVPVDVWGAVGQPGRYEVAPGTGLLEVLTLAGGPRVTTDDARTAQTATVSLSRATGATRSLVYEGTLEALTTGAAPAVEPGDLVTVRLTQRQRFSWRDALSVATASASLVLVILRITERGL